MAAAYRQCLHASTPLHMPSASAESRHRIWGFGDRFSYLVIHSSIMANTNNGSCSPADKRTGRDGSGAPSSASQRSRRPVLSPSQPVPRLQPQHRDSLCMPRQPLALITSLVRVSASGVDGVRRSLHLPSRARRATTDPFVAFAVSSKPRHCANNVRRELASSVAEPSFRIKFFFLSYPGMHPGILKKSM